MAAALVFAHASWPAAQQQASAAQQTAPAQAPPAQTAPNPNGQAAPVAPPVPAYGGLVIVLNPGHGGTDSGARGENGVAEKDFVMQFARAARDELQRQGYHVVMTRDDDSNPSYDDRDAASNIYRDAIFISLHVGSTGTFGDARAYYYQFWTPAPPSAASNATAASANPAATPTFWEDAQRSYTDASRRLADLLAAQLAQSFSGSPSASSAAAVRELRSVTAPAIALEISSMSASNPERLTGLAGPLAIAISRAVEAFRPPNSAGGH